MTFFRMSLNGSGARTSMMTMSQAMLPSAFVTEPAESDRQTCTRWYSGVKYARSATSRGMASSGKKMPEKRKSGVMKSV